MKKKNEIFLVLAALIWGVAFVAQSSGGDVVGPYSFNCIRSLIGAMVLLPVIFVKDKLTGSRSPKGKELKTLIIGGVASGSVLSIASSLQQLGITMGTGTGKAGFLTACYIVLVPIVGLFIGKKCKPIVWVGALITIVGLYLLCMEGSFQLSLSDILLILCAVVFAVQILIIDHFSPLVDGVRLSAVQFATSGTILIIPMVWQEVCKLGVHNWTGNLASWDAWIPILYAGVMSCGVAYTFQILGQRNVNPAVASLLMSLESVFSVIAGALLLHQFMSIREIIGCVLIFIAVIMAQLGES